MTDIDLTKLCHYDRRNPYFDVNEENGYTKEDFDATGNFGKKDCACDNCYYGRTKLTEQLLELKESSFDETDMINFAFDTYCYISGIMKVSFNQVSKNKLHAIDNLEQFKKKQT